MSTLGSLSNDDGDDNENGKKAMGLDKREWARSLSLGLDSFGKTTTLHVYQAFFYISLPSLHDYNVKVPDFTFCRGRERRQWLSFSFAELWYSLLEFNSTEICQHLTNWTSWNKRDKVWSSANSLIELRFRKTSPLLLLNLPIDIGDDILICIFWHINLPRRKSF